MRARRYLEELARFLKLLVRPAVRGTEDEIIRNFHDLYFWGRMGEPRIFAQASWMGVPCVKCPLDLWIYQEILSEVCPDLVVETGTYAGGTTLFLAHILDLLGNGAVVSIDIEDRPRSAHPRIRYVTGPSTDAVLVRRVLDTYERTRCLVIFDSDHSRDHVLREMELFFPYVSVGSYMIVEDTNRNGHPVCNSFGPGPYEAVAEFLSHHDNFTADRSREKFLMTFNPNGYLKRIT